MNRLVFIVVPLAALILLAGPATAVADGTAAAPPPQSARFAIIVGVNQSVDADAHPLRYADDDAAAYLELFRALGARTYLLSRFDEGTRRLHPQAVAEAYDPRRRELDRMVEQVSADVALARRRGVPTIVYFIYAGHGGVENGRGYLALEDARLYGADLEQLIVDRVGGAETHFIVDACYSAFLAVSRGPGGERQEARGFSTLGGLAARPGVGLLLSTSSARESHEWSEFQAGVFSHEVRSGLLGAADADGDGQISYREIAAFVDRANAPIPNERLRPDVYAKEPASARTLLDLRTGLARRLELDGQHPGHYFIEDARGVRLADFHNAPGQPLHLMRPVGDGPLYLRKLGEQAGDDLEYLMDAAPAVAAVLSAGRRRLRRAPAHARGAVRRGRAPGLRTAPAHRRRSHRGGRGRRGRRDLGGALGARRSATDRNQPARHSRGEPAHRPKERLGARALRNLGRRAGHRDVAAALATAHRRDAASGRPGHLAQRAGGDPARMVRPLLKSAILFRHIPSARSFSSKLTWRLS